MLQTPDSFDQSGQIVDRSLSHPKHHHHLFGCMETGTTISRFQGAAAQCAQKFIYVGHNDGFFFFPLPFRKRLYQTRCACKQLDLERASNSTHYFYEVKPDPEKIESLLRGSGNIQ